MSISIILAIVFGFLFLAILLSYVPVALWIKAAAAGIQIRVIQLIGMRLRHVDPKKIIIPMIRAKEYNIDLEPNYTEAHYLAGGNIDNLVGILIDAQYENINLSFEDACLINYKGYDFNTYKNKYGLS